MKIATLPWSPRLKFKYPVLKSVSMKLLIVLFLLLLPVASAIEINEIMYNPVGDDSGNEWVEIYNPGHIDLSNWTIGDLSANKTLAAVRITDSDFLLVVENNRSFGNSNASIYYAGSLIGNGLGNSGDSVFLYDKNKTLIDSVAYNSTFANGNNKTLEKFNSSWQESIADGGTPGFENSVSFVVPNFTNQTNLTEANLTDNSTDQTNVSANDTNQTSANLTNANQTNSTSNETANPPACVSSIKINATKEIYTDEAIKFRHIVNSSDDNFSIIYWVEDLFGNVVKSEYETKTISEKSFTPHLDERDTVYVIKSILKGCNESYGEKMVAYKTEKEIADTPVNSTKQESSGSGTGAANSTKPKFSYELTSYSDEIMQDTEASATVQITSDDSPHEVYIQAYIYRYSKKYSEIAEEGFTIESLASETYELAFLTNATPGDYKMKIKINKDEQKTDYEITRNVTVVKNDELEENKTFENVTATPQKPKNITYPVNITNQSAIYQSKQVKSFSLVPIIIIGILVAISGVLIWKR